MRLATKNVITFRVALEYCHGLLERQVSGFPSNTTPKRRWQLQKHVATLKRGLVEPIFFEASLNFQKPGLGSHFNGRVLFRPSRTWPSPVGEVPCRPPLREFPFQIHQTNGASLVPVEIQQFGVRAKLPKGSLGQPNPWDGLRLYPRAGRFPVYSLTLWRDSNIRRSTWAIRQAQTTVKSKQ